MFSREGLSCVLTKIKSSRLIYFFYNPFIKYCKVMIIGQKRLKLSFPGVLLLEY